MVILSETLQDLYHREQPVTASNANSGAGGWGSSPFHHSALETSNPIIQQGVNFPLGDYPSSHFSPFGTPIPMPNPFNPYYQPTALFPPALTEMDLLDQLKKASTTKQPVADRKSRLYVAMSPQRGGKTTLGRKWLRREVDLGGHPDDGFPRHVWDSDILRKILTGKAYHPEAEGFVFAFKSLAIRCALETSDVYVAGTCTSRTSLRRMLEIDRNAIPVVIDTDVEICLQRAIDTRQAYLLSVIPRVHRQLRELLDHGIDRVIEEILADMDDNVPY